MRIYVYTHTSLFLYTYIYIYIYTHIHVLLSQYDTSDERPKTEAGGDLRGPCGQAADEQHINDLL